MLLTTIMLEVRTRISTMTLSILAPSEASISQSTDSSASTLSSTISPSEPYPSSAISSPADPVMTVALNDRPSTTTNPENAQGNISWSAGSVAGLACGHALGVFLGAMLVYFVRWTVVHAGGYVRQEDDKDAPTDGRVGTNGGSARLHADKTWTEQPDWRQKHTCEITYQFRGTAHLSIFQAPLTTLKLILTPDFDNCFPLSLLSMNILFS
ncbi:hypothetical protein BJ742DRAFT_126497 [Cladochytrium replicatum]|nr:hypothetical protein BJ742DRAFT_126497 [Cladochytrium replicatum]